MDGKVFIVVVCIVFVCLMSYEVDWLCGEVHRRIREMQNRFEP